MFRKINCYKKFVLPGNEQPGPTLSTGLYGRSTGFISTSFLAISDHSWTGTSSENRLKTTSSPLNYHLCLSKTEVATRSLTSLLRNRFW